MQEKKELKILFIGNSHTYYNDMPSMVKARAEQEGFACHVTMLAHPGWFLIQHLDEPAVRFNILYGKYDYVVLQEHAHPFGPEEKFLEAVTALNQYIRDAGSIPVIYACWARKNEREAQEQMNEVHRRMAQKIDALIAPVGENWWNYKDSRPEIEMYAEDGAHASVQGSDFAASLIWNTIHSDIERRETQLSCP